jgi:hypothetical protein
MKKETKLLAATCGLPVLRDLLEDLVEDKSLRYEAKKHANNVINSIDRFSQFLMKGAEREANEQEIDFELWFRNSLQSLEVED